MKKTMAKYKNVLKIVPFNEIILERGDGNWVWDINGNKYLDLNSGQFCLSFGHNDKNMQKVVLDQMSKIYHTNTSTLTPEVFQACEDMASITGGKLTKTIFLSTGSEANECAFRYTRFATGKNSIIAMKFGYHGLTLGSQQLTMGGMWAKPIENKHNYYIEDFSSEKLEHTFNEILKKANNDVAAVITEPVLGVGGVLVPPKEFFHELRRLCTKYGILLIFDECQTGFGRSGEWFAYQKIGIEPDVLVCAKAMGVGFAVSSVTFNSDLAKIIENKVVHFSSHQNDPLSCRLVSYVINKIKNGNYLEHNREMGAYLFKKLLELKEKHPKFISQPRGLGLMLGFDIKDGQFEKNPNITNDFLRRLEREGVLLQAIRKGHTLRLSPSFNITKEEINFLINKLDLVINELA